MLPILALAVVLQDPKLQPQPYSTLDAAGTAAVKQAFAASNEFEYGGPIYRRLNDSTFWIAVPSTQKDSVSVQYKTAPAPAGYVIAATFHTHPCLDIQTPEWNGYFSAMDQRSGNELEVPSYLGDMCSGSVLRLEPERTVVRLTPPPKPKAKTAWSIDSSAHLEIEHWFEMNLDFAGRKTERRTTDELCKEATTQIARSAAKHKSEVRIEMGDRSTEMTCREFVRRIFGSAP